MPDIKVSFFCDMSYDSRTRHVFLLHMVGDRLHMVICQIMIGGEFFARYHRPAGGVLALERQGVRVQLYLFPALWSGLNAKAFGRRVGLFYPYNRVVSATGFEPVTQ